MQNGTDAESRSDVKPPSDGGRATAGTPGIPTELFPVSGFLRALLDQEKTLWERNEIILKSLKGMFQVFPCCIGVRSRVVYCRWTWYGRCVRARARARARYSK